MSVSDSLLLKEDILFSNGEGTVNTALAGGDVVVVVVVVVVVDIVQ